ncbi:hypothetical protein FK521_27825, partial [Klebsiella pneumoniae]
SGGRPLRSPPRVGSGSALRSSLQLARYAFDQHWWDLSVQATIAGKLWDQLEERFQQRSAGLAVFLAT